MTTPRALFCVIDTLLYVLTPIQFYHTQNVLSVLFLPSITAHALRLSLLIPREALRTTDWTPKTKKNDVNWKNIFSSIKAPKIVYSHVWQSSKKILPCDVTSIDMSKKSNMKDASPDELPTADIITPTKRQCHSSNSTKNKHSLNQELRYKKREGKSERNNLSSFVFYWSALSTINNISV